MDHKKCGERPVDFRTPYNKQRLRQAVNHKTGLSQRNLAGRFNCSQAYNYISKTLATGYSNPIKCRKRVKTPYYTYDENINSTKTKCRKLYNHTAGKLIVMDDEKYFGLTGYQEVFISTRLTPHKLQLKSRTGPKVSLNQRCFYGLQYQRMGFRALYTH